MLVSVLSARRRFLQLIRQSLLVTIRLLELELAPFTDQPKQSTL